MNFGERMRLNVERVTSRVPTLGFLYRRILYREMPLLSLLSKYRFVPGAEEINHCEM